MRRGFFSTAQKQSTRALSGRVRRCRGQRKQDSQSQNSKSCWSHSSMWEASPTLSSYHRTRQSISKSTDKSCSVCLAQCFRRDKSCGRANCGCFTTAMHLLTMPWYSDSSWPKRKSPCWNSLPINLTLLHVTFFFSPSSRGVIKGTRIEDMEIAKMDVTTSWGAFQKNPSSSALKCGREGWKSALDLRGITLKVKPWNCLDLT